MSLGNPDRPIGGLAVPRPTGVELRPFGRDDFKVALALARELYGLPETDPAPHHARYEALVANPDAVPFLALADGEPAGAIVFRFRRRLNHATFEGWVSDLIVREGYRRRGIGRALLAAVVAEWRLRGSHQLMLEVAYERSAARSLYASAGIEERGKYFEAAPVRSRGVTAEGVEIRPAEDGDFEAVTRLLAELGRPAPSDEQLPAVRRVYDAHLVRPDTASMLAVLEGAAIGFCSLEFREPFYTLSPQAWIPDLIVTDAARGRHVGAVLLDAAFAEAERRDAYAAALESGHHRSTAHLLYASAAMTEVGSFYTLQR